MKKMNRMASWLMGCLMLFACNSFTLAQQQNFSKVGVASFYADKFEGKVTASGEKYYHAKPTAAHPSLPFGTIVKVTNLSNHKTTAVRINDRGPNVPGRIIDLSRSSARKLGFIAQGKTRVRIEVIDHLESTKEQDQKSSETKKRNVVRFSANIEKGSGFAVQLGSYSKFTNLVKASEKINDRNQTALYIEIVEVNSKEVYRLFAGFYQDKIQAKRIKKRLSGIFPGCFVVQF